MVAITPRVHLRRGLSARVVCCAAGLTVGIDLGTTNSAIAVLRDGGVPTIVPNARGEPTTPSVVAYTAAGGVLVGQEAVEQAHANVANTVVSAKRFIGRSYRAARADVGAVGFAVREDEEGGGVLFSCPAAAEALAPEEVSAQLLIQLLDDAERATGVRAARGVVTVPAYFNDAQRRATRVAAQLAGLEQVELLAEPVAACLAYGLSGAVGTALVFDLGAGTFDVSALRLTGGGATVEVIATSGDSHLGGSDFDARIVAHLLERAEAAGLPASAGARRGLSEAAEAAKKRLSVVKAVRVDLTEACERGGAGAVSEVGGSSESGAVTELSRATVEALCEPLLQRLRAPLYEVSLTSRIALPGEAEETGVMRKKPNAKARKQLAKIRPSGRQKYLPLGTPVDEIVLVGGATHMVAVRKLVANLFGVDPRRTVNPMEAVALGAALHAGVLSGEVSGVRVRQAWQVRLGEMLDRMEQGTRRGEEEEDEEEDEEDEEEEDEDAAAVAEYYRRLEEED